MKEVGNTLVEECWKLLPGSKGKKYLGTCIYKKPADWIDLSAREGQVWIFTYSLMFVVVVMGAIVIKICDRNQDRFIRKNFE